MDEVATQDLEEPASHLREVGNEIPDQTVHPDDLPEVDIESPLRVTFGKRLQYSATLWR